MAFEQDDCCSEASGVCLVTVANSQSQPKESVRAIIKWHALWIIVAPRPLVSPDTVANVLLVVNTSLVGTTTTLVIYLYFFYQICLE